MEKCASGEPKEQALPLQALVKMKADSAVPVILELLHSSDEGIRFCAAEFPRFPLLARHSQNIIAKLALLKSQSNNV